MDIYKKMRILVVVGTRPEAIKMAPVVQELKRASEFETLVVSTGQHRQMLDQALSLFQIKPDIDLDLMQPNQDLADIFSRVLLKMKATLAELKPDLMLVQGDTTTVCAAALANLVGTGREVIRAETARLLRDSVSYAAMTRGGNPYGDGQAAQRIIEVIRRWSQGRTPLLEPQNEFCPETPARKRLAA